MNQGALESIDVDGTPFSVLMDRAVKLKYFQSKHDRLKYDAHPSFYQKTIFHNDDVASERRLDQFDERFAAANRFKEEGNSSFRDGRLHDALIKYEMAASVFRFLQNKNPEWKSQGIKDQFITEVKYECKTEAERHELDRFLVACYNNIAVVSCKMNDFSLAVNACDYAIAIDGRNDKTLYLRARARLDPKSSGTVEETLARSDLSMALKINPENREARKLLQRLDCDMKNQRAKNKITFRGLFDRGTIYDPRELHERKEVSRKRAKQDELESKQRGIILGKQLVQLYEERGVERVKKKIERSLKNEMEVMEKRACVDDMDFRNPTAIMVLDAKSMGVDLTDPQTVELLENLKAGGDQEWVRNSEGSSKQSKPEWQVTRPRQFWLRRLHYKILSGIILAGFIFAYMK
ncbi:hypothetical protein ACHAW5_008447 [Stephanodiscus triporus]|uniref:Peptidylprolyl isomerase n=1 Tax=Stephanodiscus triporus TaxID=2934178 RepID=A0ABD3MI93_9STRA